MYSVVILTLCPLTTHCVFLLIAVMELQMTSKKWLMLLTQWASLCCWMLCIATHQKTLKMVSTNLMVQIIVSSILVIKELISSGTAGSLTIHSKYKMSHQVCYTVWLFNYMLENIDVLFILYESSSGNVLSKLSNHWNLCSLNFYYNCLHSKELPEANQQLIQSRGHFHWTVVATQFGHN